jgi:hypothetical protein
MRVVPFPVPLSPVRVDSCHLILVSVLEYTSYRHGGLARTSEADQAHARWVLVAREHAIAFRHHLQWLVFFCALLADDLLEAAQQA